MPMLRKSGKVAASLGAAIMLMAAAPLADLPADRTGPCQTAKGGWCDFVQTSADKTWLYAQMSQNAYGENRPVFKLPANITADDRVGNDGIDFAYRIYKRHDGPRLTEVIIAFRGTEGLGDWIFGNLLARQNRRGLAVVRRVFQELADRGQSDVEVSVTGHSLGGGIAHHVSLREIELDDGSRRKVTRSYVFNNSPRYWRKHGRWAEGVERIATVEYGEILKLFRGPASEATQTYLTLNCRSNGIRAVRDHSMHYLAGCLTWIAAIKGNPAALASLGDNPIEKPEGQKSDFDPRQTD